MAYSIKWEENGVYIDFHGTLHRNDLIEFNFQIVGNQKFDRLKYQICDFTNVNDINGEIDDTKFVAAINTQSATWNNKLDIVCVTTNDTIIGFIEMYKTLIKDTKWKIQITDTLDSALNILEKHKID